MANSLETTIGPGRAFDLGRAVLALPSPGRVRGSRWRITSCGLDDVGVAQAAAEQVVAGGAAGGDELTDAPPVYVELESGSATVLRCSMPGGRRVDFTSVSGSEMVAAGRDRQASVKPLARSLGIATDVIQTYPCKPPH